MSAPDSRPAASEQVLVRLNEVADTDITVMLRCATTSVAGDVRSALVGLATDPRFAALGRRARRLERADRRYGADQRVGPIDLTIAPADPNTVIVRWSHLAGDAWSLQEFIAEALGRVGLTTPDIACDCSTKWRDDSRPITPAGIWQELGAGVPSALATAWPAAAPLFRRVCAPLRSSSAPGDPEAVAMLDMPLGPRPASGASRFSRMAGLTAALLADGTGRPCRLGVTVNLRRHEALGRSGGIGNASAVGYVNVHGGRDDERVVDAKLRRLIGSRFWRQQAALDAWLGVAPAALADVVAGAVVQRAASVAPVTVTELWRRDRLTCRQCGLPRRTLADAVDALAFPPALPPAGLTVGVTRSLDRIRVVLRRTATPRESATAWLEHLMHDRAKRLEAAGVTCVTIRSLAHGFPVLP